MWQSAYSRKRALSNQRKKQGEKTKVGLQLKRVEGEIKLLYGEDEEIDQIESVIVPARIMLTDITPQGLGFFAPAPILVGQEVAITLEKPKRFYCKAKVTWCQMQDINILSETPYQYRMGLEFIFQSDREKDAVKTFCDNLKQEHVVKKRNSAQNAA